MKPNSRHETLKSLHIQKIETERDYLDACTAVEQATKRRMEAKRKLARILAALNAIKANQEKKS